MEAQDDYTRRGPYRGYSPRRDGGYRDDFRNDFRRGGRLSPGREYHDDRARYRYSPRQTQHYPPPRPNRYDDAYRRTYPPQEPYQNGSHNGRPYERPMPRDATPRDVTPRDLPSNHIPPRDQVPPRDSDFRPREGGYQRDYDRGRHW